MGVKSRLPGNAGDRVGYRSKCKMATSLSRYKKSSLSMISEGDELIKLRDVLDSKEGWLTQEELWAICKECCLTLKRLSSSTEILQSLCVMLETVAFDCQGYVCFVDHESEEDRRYRPPEYEKIGNSTKGFIYSLGVVMYEASAYNSDVSVLPQHSPKLKQLLKRMMEVDYSDRINLEGVLTETEEFFYSYEKLSSLEICKLMVHSVIQPLSARLDLIPKPIHSYSEDETSSPILHSECNNTVSTSSSSSSLLTTSVDMSLQDLVDKYKPKSTQGTAGAVVSKNSTAMLENDHGTDGDEQQSSAFVVKHGGTGHVKIRETSEGASLKAGSTPFSLKLPNAFSSSETHFSPIILENNGKKTSLSPSSSQTSTSTSTATSTESRTSHQIMVLKRHLLKSHADSQEFNISPRDRPKSSENSSHNRTSSSPDALKSSDSVSPRDSNQPSSKIKSPEKMKSSSRSKLRKMESSSGTKLEDAIAPYVQASYSRTTETSRKLPSSKPTPAPKPSVKAQPYPTNAVRPVPRQPGNQSPVSIQDDVNMSSNNNNSSYHTASIQPPPTIQHQSVQPQPAVPLSAQPQPVIPQSVQSQPVLPQSVQSESVQPHSILPPPIEAPPTTMAVTQLVATSDNQQQVVNRSSLSTPAAIIPSYQRVPVMLSGDQGQVNWIPVVPGTTVYDLAPAYNVVPWAMASPQRPQQQVPHSFFAQPQQTVAVIQPPDTPLYSSPHVIASSTQAPNSSTDSIMQQLTATPSAPTSSASTSSSTGHNIAVPGVDPTVTSAEVSSIAQISTRKQASTATTKKSRAGKGAAPKAASRKSRQEGQGLKKTDKDSGMLLNVRQLIRREFAFAGYMQEGQEDLDIAQFIGSLPALDYTGWSNVIVAKYGDLYWSDELLTSLYEAVHNKPPVKTTDRPSSTSSRSSSARVVSVEEPVTLSDGTHTSGTHRYTTSPFRPIPTDDSVLSVIPSSTPRKTTLRSLIKPEPVRAAESNIDSGMADLSLPLGLNRVKSASVQELNFSSVLDEDLSRESYPPPAGPLVKSRSQSNITSLRDRAPLQTASRARLTKDLVLGNGKTRQMIYIEGKIANNLPDFSWNTAKSLLSAFEQESDSHSHSSASELRIKSKLHSIEDKLNEISQQSRISSECESDTSLASYLHQSSIISNVCGTITYAHYLAHNPRTIANSDEEMENMTNEELKKRISELSQQISVSRKRKAKTTTYIKRIIDTSTQHTDNKSSMDYKTMLHQMKNEYEETAREIERLTHLKCRLEVQLADQASIDPSYLHSFTKNNTPLLVTQTEKNPTLQFQTKHESSGEQALYAGKPIGLVAYLYATGALKHGYIMEFFYSFRYCIDPCLVLAFISGKFKSAKEMEPCDLRTKILKRSLDLLVFWVSSYYSVDFAAVPPLIPTLVNFLQEEVMTEHPAEYESLMKLIDEQSSDHSKVSEFIDPVPHMEPLPYIDEDSNPLTRRTLRRNSSILKKSELEEWSEPSKWNSSRVLVTIGSGKSAVQYKRTGQGIVSCMSMTLKKSLSRDSYHLTTSNESDSFAVSDHSSVSLANQLTLMEQELFVDIHPVNVMDTLAQGISASLADNHKSGSWDSVPLKEMRLMFQRGYLYVVVLLPMIQHAKKISHWVTAEIISASNTKAQTTLVTKFLQVAKICKELGNFATCLSIKDGLDHILIRHIPAWKDVPSKLLQELNEAQMQHTTDPLSQRPDEESPGLPRIPSILPFALHIQQLEQGGFTFTNGLYRWAKLRSLAQAVDIIRLCKRFKYNFELEPELSKLLMKRITEMNILSLESLAVSAASQTSRSSNSIATARWTNVFKKVKNKL